MLESEEMIYSDSFSRNYWLNGFALRRWFFVGAVALIASADWSRSYAASGISTNMAPIAITGWNADVVVEATAVGPPFTNVAVEVNAGEGDAYYQTG